MRLEGRMKLFLEYADARSNSTSTSCHLERSKGKTAPSPCYTKTKIKARSIIHPSPKAKKRYRGFRVSQFSFRTLIPCNIIDYRHAHNRHKSRPLSFSHQCSIPHLDLPQHHSQSPFLLMRFSSWDLLYLYSSSPFSMNFFDSIVIIPFPLSFLVTFLLVAFPHRHSPHAFLPMPFSPCPLPHALPPTPTLHHNLLMLAWHCTKRSQALHTPYHFHTGPSSASPLSFPSL